MSFYTRINTDLLYPPFWEKLQLLEPALKAKNEVFIATCGMRTWEEQAVAYAIGRTTGKPGHYVTKAKPGYSLHQYGLAADLAHDADKNELNNLQPDWTTANYQVLADTAQEVGLEAGYYWHFQDAPHLQVAIGKFGLSINDLVHTYEQGGVSAVWKLLDKFKW